MIEEKIDYLAYQLKENKKEGHGAIVFLGAGCSVSAGIPIASIIVDEILEKHKENPRIQNLSHKPTYAELMECLGPHDRNKIFKSYVEKAKINVSHIYLAHLLAKGYIDYIVTVNFDNLAQRALALYNIFPPTYDISILKDMPSRSLDTESITYLHGHHNGLWQLNTKDEMDIIIKSNVAKTIFDKIAINRLWIVVGYSGQDRIFSQLASVNRFYKGLYWVGYNNNEPLTNVQNDLLNIPNTESFWIKGYDADSFFINLNAKLTDETPKIFKNPFTFLSELQENIIEISDSEEYKLVKQRFITSKSMTKEAINRYERLEELGDNRGMDKNDIERNKIKNALTDCIIRKNYTNLDELINLLNKGQFFDLLSMVGEVYYSWGNHLAELAKSKSFDESEELFILAFKKFDLARYYKINMYRWFLKWGDYLVDFAKTKSGVETNKLYNNAFDMYKEALKIKPDFHEAYFNWGTYLVALAKETIGDDKQKYYKQAFEKYKKTVEIKPDFHEAYFNWGNSLAVLAEVSTGSDKVKYFKQAFEKYEKAVEIKPDFHEAYFNWGTYLVDLAKKTTGDDKLKYFKQAFKKYEKAVEIKPDFHEAYFNWGTYLADLAKKTTGDDKLKYFEQAFEKYEKAVEIKPDYNEVYFNWGTSLVYLAEYPIGDDKVKYKYYSQAIEQYNKAAQIKSGDIEVLNNWAVGILKLARLQSGVSAEELYNKALELCSKIVELGGSSYNLACAYALTNKIDEAFRLLEICLKKNEIKFEYIETDLDWDNLRQHPRYLFLKARYPK